MSSRGDFWKKSGLATASALTAPPQQGPTATLTVPLQNRFKEEQNAVREQGRGKKGGGIKVGKWSETVLEHQGQGRKGDAPGIEADSPR